MVIHKNDPDAFRNKGYVLLTASGGSNLDHILDWYQNYEKRAGWHSYGTALNDPEEAGRIGASIC